MKLNSHALNAHKPTHFSVKCCTRITLDFNKLLRLLSTSSTPIPLCNFRLSRGCNSSRNGLSVLQNAFDIVLLVNHNVIGRVGAVLRCSVRFSRYSQFLNRRQTSLALRCGRPRISVINLTNMRISQPA